MELPHRTSNSKITEFVEFVQRQVSQSSAVDHSGVGGPQQVAHQSKSNDVDLELN